MKTNIRLLLTLVISIALTAATFAGDSAEATGVVDKAIKAMGGQEKLGAMKAVSVSIKGKLTVNNADSDFTMTFMTQGLDHIRQHFEADIDTNHIDDLRVIAGDKAWRKNADGVETLDDQQANGLRRTAYLALVATNPSVLKDKAFTLESASEEQAGDKHLISVKVAGPDKKEFTISFDKETSLPTKVTGQVLSYTGNEVTQETVYEDYQEKDGIKKAMHAVVSHDGEKLLDEHVTEFKALDKAAPEDAFAEPK